MVLNVNRSYYALFTTYKLAVKCSELSSTPDPCLRDCCTDVELQSFALDNLCSFDQRTDAASMAFNQYSLNRNVFVESCTYADASEHGYSPDGPMSISWNGYRQCAALAHTHCHGFLKQYES